MAMYHSCGENPFEKIGMYDENAKFERRNVSYESEPKWLKICDKGYKYDNGKSFVEVTCSSKHEWTLDNGAPVPRYLVLKGV